MEKDESKVEGPETINYRGIKAMPFVIGNETFEKLGTTGTLANLLVYFTSVFHMKTITATTLVNAFGGTTNFATLIGAVLCDTCFGRYKTLAFACIASLMGMIVLTLTAALPELHPASCGKEDTGICAGPTPWQIAFLFGGLGLLVVGAGGIRPCNLAFGADQFNPKTDSGKRGISSFFNWYYFTFTFAMMVSLSIIVYVQSDVSWAWGLGIPAFLMCLSCVMFFMGSRIYVKVKPEGSPLASVLWVIVAAIKKRKLNLPEQTSTSLFNYVPACSINSKLPHTEQFRFLDKAAIVTPEDQVNKNGSSASPWRLCSMQQVEEVKCLTRVIPIWVAVLIFLVSQSFQGTYVVFQALQSDRRVGNTSFKIPAATYTIFTMIALTIWIPIYDRFIVPSMRRLTNKEGGITLLQKMGCGVVIAVVAMVIAAIVENKRRELGLKHPISDGISSLSAMWLVPQLTLVGISEAFTVIGQFEFYYREFPENMRSIGQSMAGLSFAGSSYLCGLMIYIVHQITKRNGPNGDWLPDDLNKGRLDYFYYVVAALQVLNFCYFLVCADWYKYKASGDGGNSDIEVGTVKLQPEKSVV